MQLSEQEDLIVWMRTAALPTFRKLYGRIEADAMASDEITVVIQNNYNTYSFGGTKALVLSTTSWIGGRNNFIGVAYVAIGGVCLFLALAFVILYVIKPRYEYDGRTIQLQIVCMLVFSIFFSFSGRLETPRTCHGTERTQTIPTEGSLAARPALGLVQCVQSEEDTQLARRSSIGSGWLFICCSLLSIS